MTWNALAALEPVLAANPDEERALLLWSQIKLDVGAQQPFSLLQASVDRNPENEALRLQLARLLASAEVLDQAREQFAMLLTLSPRNGDYLFSLALIELEAKDYQAAKRNLQDLIGLGQRLDEAHYYLGRAHENLQEEEQAIEAYDQVGPGRGTDATRRSGTAPQRWRNLEFRDGPAQQEATQGQAEQPTR